MSGLQVHITVPAADRIVALDKETYFCLKTGKVETDYQNDKIISLEKDGLL